MMRAALRTARRIRRWHPGFPPVPCCSVADGVRFAGTLVRVQTPQAFRAGPPRRLPPAEAEGFDGTDTSSCVQRFTDVDVHVFAGPRRI